MRMPLVPLTVAILLLAITWALPAACGEISLRDDSGARVRLPAPARRIVSLSPGSTELLFSAGAGGMLVGTSNYSDFPAAARLLPRVGDSAHIDAERIISLRPDLVVVWPHGAGQRQVGQLRRLGIPVYVSDPRTLEDLARTVETFGRIAGTQSVAMAVAGEFRRQLGRLRDAHLNAKPVRAFLQIADAPLMTVNDRHLIADVLHACGGSNVFGAAGALAPVVDPESILAAAPQAIVMVADDPQARAWRAAWLKRPGFAAVRSDALLAVSAESLARLTLRVAQGAVSLCAQIDALRARR
jgi:iron complex transport system substrate-binding protein